MPGPGDRRAQRGDGPALPGGSRSLTSWLVVLAMGPASARAPPPQRCAARRLLSVLLPAAEPQQWPPSSCARPAAHRPRRRPAPARRRAGLPPGRRRHLRPLAALAVALPRSGPARPAPPSRISGMGPGRRERLGPAPVRGGRPHESQSAGCGAGLRSGPGELSS